MFSSWSQFASSSQFLLHGRQNFTRTAWEKASKAYLKPDILEVIDLSGKVYMVTGCNTGIGKEIVRYLAHRRATVYMVCRNSQKAELAKWEISSETNNQNIFCLIGDCSLETDIRKVWSDFLKHNRENLGKNDSEITLDGLVCNAGALCNEMTLTSEGIEVMFATHLLFGVYLLGTLAMPVLTATLGARLVVVSSGGLYNTKMPTWDILTSTKPGAAFDGQFLYAQTKRAQLLLCERWSEQYFTTVKVVCCHPGWVQTDGIDKAYGESKKYFEPLRTAWQGAEGICWLCVAPTEQLKGGGFYLDRKPQVKHMAGPFFTEGSFTKNTRAEVDELMLNMNQWASGLRPQVNVTIDSMSMVATNEMEPMQRPLEIKRIVGRWHVFACSNVQSAMNTANYTEVYEWNRARSCLEIVCEMADQRSLSISDPDFTSNTMVAIMENAPLNTVWKVRPSEENVFMAVNKRQYVLDAGDDYSYLLFGTPDRDALWIMVRHVPSDYANESVSVFQIYDLNQRASTGADVLSPQIQLEKEILLLSLMKANQLGFDCSSIVRVPWTAEKNN